MSERYIKRAATRRWPVVAAIMVSMVVKIEVKIVAMMAAMVILGAVLGGCSAGYYWQAVQGQVKLLRGREPVAEVLSRPDIDPQLRTRLALAQQVLAFAHEELLLPDNGSYTTYYDTGAPYIVWNVVAAPEFALAPKTWCFPVAGCVAYRGYFSQESAQRYARKLADQGHDIYMGGVAAYSTLGRFKDPVLSTMIKRSEESFVALLFHELAHQRVYIKDSTAFNEGFATVVEQMGSARWRAARGLPNATNSAVVLEQLRAVMELLETTRMQLAQVYESSLPEPDKRRAKAAIISAIGEEYEQLMGRYRQAGLQSRPYEGLILGGLNNASLAAVGSYQDLVPAFKALEIECELQLECFYERAEQLGKMVGVAREAEINRLLTQSAVRAAKEKSLDVHARSTQD
jgi:predicted aminopeptidase